MTFVIHFDVDMAFWTPINIFIVLCFLAMAVLSGFPILYMLILVVLIPYISVTDWARGQWRGYKYCRDKVKNHGHRWNMPSWRKINTVPIEE